MAERVYECGLEELSALKKRLEYDPYLDESLIPPPLSDTKIPATQQAEASRQQEERNKKVQESLEKLKNDKYSGLIFVRQEYEIIDGSKFGAAEGTSYIYIKASEDFLNLAESFFKETYKTVKRAEPVIEEKIIKQINEEKRNADLGFGSIFGQ
ncbi:MAG: hypothetical protein ACP5RP_03860 [Candidatus Micrarchaeia archaeon]